MVKTCPGCNKNSVTLRSENIGKVINRYGTCKCGYDIDFDEDFNGTIVRNSSKYPKSEEPSSFKV